MHFAIEHEFAAAPAAVAAAMLDAAFQCTIDLPDLSRPEVVEQTTTGTGRSLKLRYEFVGHLDPIAKRALGNRKLTWLQELRLDVSTFTGTLTFAADGGADRLNGEAAVTLTATGTGTRRAIDGDFHVRVPLIGGTAEKKIVPGLVRRLGIEAEAVASHLTDEP